MKSKERIPLLNRHSSETPLSQYKMVLAPLLNRHSSETPLSQYTMVLAPFLQFSSESKANSLKRAALTLCKGKRVSNIRPIVRGMERIKQELSRPHMGMCVRERQTDRQIDRQFLGSEGIEELHHYLPKRRLCGLKGHCYHLYIVLCIFSLHLRVSKPYTIYMDISIS